MATLVELLAAHDYKKSQGNWYPACGGKEEAFTTRSGYRLLYCYQPSTHTHAYLNLDTDMILSNEEAIRILGLVSKDLVPLSIR
jgi:hypothetical protein